MSLAWWVVTVIGVLATLYVAGAAWLVWHAPVIEEPDALELRSEERLP